MENSIPRKQKAHFHRSQLDRLLIDSNTAATMKGSVLLAAVVVSAIALATGLPYSDYCIGCMTTVESLFLLHRESKIVGNELPTASDITMLLCDAAYFDVFQDFVKDGCKQMRNSAPNTFRSMVADALTSEFELANPSDSKKEYFSFAREVSLSHVARHLIHVGQLRV